MQTRNTPISVWHSQPFEIAVLDADMRWGIVLYRNAKLKPGPNKLFRNWFIISQGQPFVGIGNRSCSEIRSWQFKSLLALPKKRKTLLKVRTVKPLLPQVPRNLEVAAVKSPPLPNSLYIIKLSAKEPTSVLRTFQIQVNETLHHLNFEILEPSDEPVLKGVNDPI
jgi:hypothetical protein